MPPDTRDPAVEAFLAVLRTTRAPRTVDAYRRDLTALATWLDGTVDTVTTEELERYLAELRARAAVAVVPSRYAEILPLAALEAMAAGVPTVAARAGGLSEAVPEEGLYEPGDLQQLAQRLQALWRDAGAGERALATAKARWAPAVIADGLNQIYRGPPGGA